MLGLPVIGRVRVASLHWGRTRPGVLRSGDAGSVGAALDQALGGHVGGQAGVGVDAVDARHQRDATAGRGHGAVHAVGARSRRARVGQGPVVHDRRQRRLQTGAMLAGISLAVGTSVRGNFRVPKLPAVEPAAHWRTASPTRIGSASLLGDHVPRRRCRCRPGRHQMASSARRRRGCCSVTPARGFGTVSPVPSGRLRRGGSVDSQQALCSTSAGAASSSRKKPILVAVAPFLAVEA